MGLIRLILIAAVVWIVVIIAKRILVRRRKPRMETTDIGETMVRCAVCHLHIPRKEALFEEGRAYCGPEHRDSARRT